MFIREVIVGTVIIADWSTELVYFKDDLETTTMISTVGFLCYVLNLWIMWNDTI